MNTILSCLFEEEGSEMYLRRAGLYVPPGAELSFFDVMAICRSREVPEVAIGFRAAHDADCVINPPNKSEKRVWAEDDMLVVLAED